MKRQWKALSVVSICCLAMSCSIGMCQLQPDSPSNYESASLLMEAKMSNSQRLLRGLVTEDFDAIGDAANKLKRIAEAAHWPTTIDEVYQHHSFEFRRQCDKLMAHAKKKDIQASHFSFLQLTTSCVDCHNYVRPRFKIERKPKGKIQLIPTWDRQQYPERPLPDDTDTITNKSKVPKIFR